jgi:hypothetical protein
MTRLLLLLVYFIVGFWCGGAYGQSSSINMAIPQTSPNFQTDRIRAGDLECSMAIGSSTNVEFGVVGIMNQDDPMYNLATQDPTFRYNSNEFIRDVGVYGRITIPLGAPKERLNCNKLYQLELEIKKLEVMRLQQEIQNLRALRFEEARPVDTMTPVKQ